MSNDPVDEVTARLERVRWPVETLRLYLRPAAPGDVATVWQYRRMASVSRWLSSQAGDLDDFAVDFARRLPKTLLMARRADDVVIGDLMVRIENGCAQRDVSTQAEHVQAELGWVLHPDFVGSGYATEAVRTLISICFTDLGLRRVVAGCFTANKSSWALMERVGMRREAHTHRDSLHRELGWQDGYTYALLADEWERADAHP